MKKHSFRAAIGMVVAMAMTLVSLSVYAAGGSINVKVTDASGNAIQGATVSASTFESLRSKSGTTDSSGELRLFGLDPSEAYVLVIEANGYKATRNERVSIVTDKTVTMTVSLVEVSDGNIEEIVVYGRQDGGQLVDTTSALQSTDITLDITESLPTGRSYQSYLQLSPSTKPTPQDGGNPGSKSGVNYQDIVDASGNTAGKSSDNVYYVDGVNITDNQTGTFGANFNSEIIQEQQIITGGVPAEYEGGQGLISKVITKSGSNEFHGSVNYYAQSDSLVADNENLEDSKFSTFDTAFTLGGPIVKDKLWFFGSYQRKEREEDIIDPVTDTVLRTVDTNQDLGFLKLTFQPTEDDRFIAEWFNDPFTRSGSDNITTVANRDSARVQGGDNFKFEYQRSWGDVIGTIRYTTHEGELSTVVADQASRNDVAYTGAAAVGITNLDTQKGGLGSDTIRFRNKQEFTMSLEWFLDTEFGTHDIKAGFVSTSNDSKVNQVFTGDGAQYTSLGIGNAGLTFDEYTGPAVFTGDQDIQGSDFVAITTAINSSSDSAFFNGLLDTDASGDVSIAELGAYTLDQTAGNPNGDVNVYRIAQTQQGATNFETKGTTFYLQDTWNINEHWTISGGLRGEKWKHFDSAGTKVFAFDFEIAPRLSVIYDINGDGASKVWAFAGRYYDPIRTNMTAFAGTVTGSIRDEQVFLGDRWLTWRTRGGPGDPDGFFAPTTKTPYTDEYMIGYERSLTENQSISITYTNRTTDDILEDYDLNLYTTPSRCGDLCLPLSYFGFEEAPAANFFIATLKGAKRKYDGVEITWRKRRGGDKWFALVSYSYNDATGNSNSDSNADFQGDVIWLDPRAINATGDQPGNVEHIVKLFGSYRFDNGIEAGATYLWNSGTLYSETFAAFGRHLPVRVDTAFEDQGVTARWLADGAIGGQKSKSFGTLNLRVKYDLLFAERYNLELFVDVFNVFDDQASRRQQDLVGGDGVFAFGESNAWILPRRFFLGARVSF